MFQALLRTATEILDSKKAAYSFIACIFASVLYLYFGVSVESALLLVSPLGLATAAQAHVDAASAKNGLSSSSSAAAMPAALAATVAPTAVVPPAGSSESTP